VKKVNLTALTGKIGITDTSLSPAGTALIDEKIYDVRTDGEFIEVGRGVRVIHVHGKKIIVKRV
jgi:membrane-bound serine protease (ClpP class)